MKVIDLTTKTQDLHVRLDGSPVYDLLAAMYLVENWTPDRGFEIDRDWVRRARRALGPALRRELRLFAKERGLIMGVVSLLERRPGLAVGEFLKAVAAAPPAELLERMLTAPVSARPSAPLLREALRARTDAALRAFVAAYPREFTPQRIRALVAPPPAEIRDRLAALLRGFYARVYQPEEAMVLPVLRDDLAARQRLADAVPAAELIERTTGGYSIGPDSGIGQVVLAPSYFFRPYNLISEYPGVRVFVYPVDLGGASAETPARDSARVFKALGDETRLRILQMLGEREMYLQEIANRLGVTHVTAIHHLALLRVAYLVRVAERDNVKYYQLRPEAAVELAVRLEALIPRAGSAH